MLLLETLFTVAVAPPSYFKPYQKKTSNEAVRGSFTNSRNIEFKWNIAAFPRCSGPRDIVYGYTRWDYKSYCRD